VISDGEMVDNAIDAEHKKTRIPRKLSARPAYPTSAPS
jgi:hypothetical protein